MATEVPYPPPSLPAHPPSIPLPQSHSVPLTLALLPPPPSPPQCPLRFFPMVALRHEVILCGCPLPPSLLLDAGVRGCVATTARLLRSPLLPPRRAVVRGGGKRDSWTWKKSLGECAAVVCLRRGVAGDDGVEQGELLRKWTWKLDVSVVLHAPLY